MKPLSAIVLAGLLTLGIGGCAIGQPSYDEVRDEANQTLQQLADLVPERNEIDRGPEQEPYICDDPLLMSSGSGAFYTGHWLIYVGRDFDIDGFILDLPARLDDRWEQRELGTGVSFAHVDLVENQLQVAVSVQEATVNERPAIEMIAISRCGVLPDDAKP